MSHVLHRTIDARLPCAAGGEGAYLIDAHGRRYLDGCGGAAVSCLGHNHPAVLAAMRAQLDKLSYAHTAFFTTEILEQLGARIIADAPENLTHAYFVSGGSEAMEAALKLARQYFLELGQPQRAHFIARRQSYHGATLGALAIGGNAQRRAPYAPLLIEAAHIAPCYAYRHRRARESEAEYAHRAAAELEQKILELGEDRVIAFIAEPVVGATAGVVPPVEGYFRRVREICDRYGVLLILDEIMCGMGRTGALYAHAREGIRADLVTIAKGLGGGYQPIGATLLDARIHAALAAGSGAFRHGHTYLGHALAAAAALAVQQTIRRDGLLDNVQQRGAELFAALRARFEAHPHIGDIRGRGLFAGLELVAERANKTPFPAGLQLHTLLQARAMQNGLMIYPGSGGIDGKNGHHIMLAPPFIFERAQVGELVDKLEVTLRQVFAQVRAGGARGDGHDGASPPSSSARPLPNNAV
ncbi:MAG: aspartate aminotransferase family protein [Gammaproteobacteria bacterium]